MNNLKEGHNKKTTREDDDESLRVRVCLHPMLTSLEGKAIQDWEVLYKDYVQQAKSVSPTSKPFLKALCVSLTQRKVIAMIKQIEFKKLNAEMILSYLEEVKREQFNEIQLDERNVFKGIVMQAPDSPDGIGKAISEFYVKVIDRVEESGLTSRFLDKDTSYGLRKKCFPTLMKGIWPREANSMLSKKWEQEGRQWMLSDLLIEIKSLTRKYGTYELSKVKPSFEKKGGESKGKPYEISKWNSYRGKYEKPEKPSMDAKEGSKYKKDSKKEWKSNKEKTERFSAKSGRDQKRWTSGGTTKVVCFNCGQAGHKKPECTLKDDHFKVIAYKKKYKAATDGLRKIGRSFTVDEQDEVGVEDQCEKEDQRDEKSDSSHGGYSSESDSQ